MKERTVQQVWLYNSGATAFQFSRLFALQRKFKPRSQQGHPPPGIPQIFRDKLVCHSLVVFTIRLNLPGQSHQNPMGRGKNRKTHTLQWVLAQEQEFLRKHRAHSLWTMVQAQEKIVFFIFLFIPSIPSPHVFLSWIMVQGAAVEWLCVTHRNISSPPFYHIQANSRLFGLNWGD